MRENHLRGCAGPTAVGNTVMWREGSWQSLQAGSRCDPRWPEYAEYARLRSAGLRDAALREADLLAASLMTQDTRTCWAFTSWIFQEVMGPSTVKSMVLPQPLEQVVLETLWSSLGNVQAWQWLAQWFPINVAESRGSSTDALRDFLREGLMKHPSDPLLSQMLARHLIAWVKIDTADLSNGRYDGDPNADLERLTEAAGLISGDDPLNASISELQATVTSWLNREPGR